MYAAEGGCRCTMARRRSSLALSPTISCATQCPPHKSPPLDHCCSAFGSNVDRPLRSTACLPQMLPALGDSAAAAPFMTNTRILCFLHKFSGAGCHLSRQRRFLGLSNLLPGFCCDFKAFDGSERNVKPRHLDYAPWQHWPRSTQDSQMF